MKINLHGDLTITLIIYLYNVRAEGALSPSVVIGGYPTSQLPRQTAAPPTLFPTSNSQRKLCQNVNALTIPPSFTTPNQKMSWVVSKITGMVQSPTSAIFGSNDMNTCSFNSYFPAHCKGLNFIMTTSDDDKTSTVETYGYNTRTKNLVHFVNKVTLADENYLIYAAPEITKMEYLSSGGSTKLVTIPETVKINQGMPFAVIALEPSFKYAVFQTCDLKSTWVGLSEELINSQPDMAVLKGYEKEIEESLYRNGIDVSTMVNIDLSFYELNNLVMATATSDPLVGSLTLHDVEKEFIKLMCKMLT